MKQIPTGGQGPAFELWVDRQKRSAIGASVNNGKRDLISTGKSTALQMIKSLTNLLKDNGMESNYYFLFNGQGWARAKAFHIKVMIDDPADCLRIADNESVKSHDVCISDVPAESAREEWLAEAKNRDDGYRHGHDTVYAEAGPVDTLGPWTLYFAVDAPRYIVKRTNPDGSVLDFDQLWDVFSKLVPWLEHSQGGEYAIMFDCKSDFVAVKLSEKAYPKELKNALDLKNLPQPSWLEGFEKRHKFVEPTRKYTNDGWRGGRGRGRGRGRGGRGRGGRGGKGGRGQGKKKPSSP